MTRSKFHKARDLGTPTVVSNQYEMLAMSTEERKNAHLEMDLSTSNYLGGILSTAYQTAHQGFVDRHFSDPALAPDVETFFGPNSPFPREAGEIRNQVLSQPVDLSKAAKSNVQVNHWPSYKGGSNRPLGSFNATFPELYADTAAAMEETHTLGGVQKLLWRGHVSAIDMIADAGYKAGNQDVAVGRGSLDLGFLEHIPGFKSNSGSFSKYVLSGAYDSTKKYMRTEEGFSNTKGPSTELLTDLSDDHGFGSNEPWLGGFDTPPISPFDTKKVHLPAWSDAVNKRLTKAYPQGTTPPEWGGNTAMYRIFGPMARRDRMNLADHLESGGQLTISQSTRVFEGGWTPRSVHSIDPLEKPAELGPPKDLSRSNDYSVTDEYSPASLATDYFSQVQGVVGDDDTPPYVDADFYHLPRRRTAPSGFPVSFIGPDPQGSSSEDDYLQHRVVAGTPIPRKKLIQTSRGLISARINRPIAYQSTYKKFDEKASNEAFAGLPTLRDPNGVSEGLFNGEMERVSDFGPISNSGSEFISEPDIVNNLSSAQSRADDHVAYNAAVNLDHGSGMDTVDFVMGRGRRMTATEVIASEIIGGETSPKLREVIPTSENDKAYAVQMALNNPKGRDAGSTVVARQTALQQQLKTLSGMNANYAARVKYVGKNPTEFAGALKEITSEHKVKLAYVPGKEAEFEQQFNQLAATNPTAAQAIAGLFPTEKEQEELLPRAFKRAKADQQDADLTEKYHQFQAEGWQEVKAEAATYAEEGHAVPTPGSVRGRGAQARSAVPGGRRTRGGEESSFESMVGDTSTPVAARSVGGGGGGQPPPSDPGMPEFRDDWQNDTAPADNETQEPVKKTTDSTPKSKTYSRSTSNGSGTGGSGGPNIYYASPDRLRMARQGNYFLEEQKTGARKAFVIKTDLGQTAEQLGAFHEAMTDAFPENDLGPMTDITPEGSTHTMLGWMVGEEGSAPGPVTGDNATNFQYKAQATPTPKKTPKPRPQPSTVHSSGDRKWEPEVFSQPTPDTATPSPTVMDRVKSFIGGIFGSKKQEPSSPIIRVNERDVIDPPTPSIKISPDDVINIEDRSDVLDNRKVDPNTPIPTGHPDQIALPEGYKNVDPKYAHSDSSTINLPGRVSAKLLPTKTTSDVNPNVIPTKTNGYNGTYQETVPPAPVQNSPIYGAIPLGEKTPGSPLPALPSGDTRPEGQLALPAHTQPHPDHETYLTETARTGDTTPAPAGAPVSHGAAGPDTGTNQTTQQRAQANFNARREAERPKRYTDSGGDHARGPLDSVALIKKYNESGLNEHIANQASNYSDTTWGHIDDKDRLIGNGGEANMSSSEVGNARSKAMGIMQQAMSGTMSSDPTDAVATFKQRIYSLSSKATNEITNAATEASGDPIHGAEVGKMFRSVLDHFVNSVAKTGESIIRRQIEGDTGETSNQDSVISAKKNAIKLTTREAIQAEYDTNPEFKAKMDKMQLTPEKGAALAPGEEQIMSGDNWSAQVGGGGRGVQMEPTAMGGRMGRFGGLMYGAYMAQQMFKMGSGGIMQETEKYAKELSGVGNLALQGTDTPISATSAGYVARENVANNYIGRTNYQNFGGFMDLPYMMSGSGDAAGRMYSSARMGAGIAGVGLAAPMVLNAAATGMSAEAAAAMAPFSAALPIAGAAIAGGLIAGTGLMELYNAQHPNDTPITFSSLPKYAERLLATTDARKKFLEQNGTNPLPMQVGDSSTMGGYREYGTPGNSSMPSDPGQQLETAVSMEQMISVMSPQQLFAYGFKDFGLDIAAYEKIANDIQGSTGEDSGQVLGSMAALQRRTGKKLTAKDAPKINDLIMAITRSGRQSTQGVAEADTYATQMGYLPGSTEYSTAINDYWLTGEVQHGDGVAVATSDAYRANKDRIAQRTSGFAAQISGFFDNPYAGGNIVNNAGITNSVQMQNVQQMMTGWSQGFGAPDEGRGQYIANTATSTNSFNAGMIGNFYANAGQAGMSGDSAGYYSSLMTTFSNDQTRFMNAGMNGDMQGLSYMSGKLGIPGNTFYGRDGRSTFETNGSSYVAAYNNWAPTLGLEQQTTSSMLGTSNQKIIDAFDKGGTVSLEAMSRQESYNTQDAMAGIAVKGIKQQMENYWGSGSYSAPSSDSMWGIEDRQRANSYTSQQADFVTQQARMDLSNSLAVEREQIQGKQMTLSQSYNISSMDISHNEAVQQRGYTEKQWQFSDTNRELNNSWNMQDVNENIRYATGRDRRQLVKQRDRMAVSQNLQEEEVEAGKDNQKLLWAQEDQRYIKNRQYQVDLAALDKQSYDLNKKSREEFLKLDQDDFSRHKKEYEENFKLQTEAQDRSRKATADQMQLQLESNAVTVAGNAIQRELNEAMKAGSEIQKSQQGIYENMAKYDKLPLIMNAMSSMMGSMNNLSPSNLDKLIKLFDNVKKVGSGENISSPYDN